MLTYIEACAAGYTFIGIDIDDIASSFFSCNVCAHTAAGFYTFIAAETIIVGPDKTHTLPPVI